MEVDALLSNSIGQVVKHVSKGVFPFEYTGATESPGQAKFHPIKYLLALRKADEKLGVVFYENTKAKKIEGKISQNVVLANGITITAHDVVIATYNPFTQPWWYIFKKGMYISYAYEIDIPKNTLPEALYEDDNNPYFYSK